MMNIVNVKGLTFDDVLIVPQYSEVRSRSDVDLSVKLGKVNLDIPIIAANMDTVCGFEMASAMDNLGGFGVVHRNLPLHERFSCVAGRTIKSAVAFGVNDDLDTVISEANRWSTKILVLDIAHGHSAHALNALRYVIAGVEHEATFIGGNVATQRAVEDFAKAGADVVKVGIGPGSVCSTRVVAGVGVPQMTAIEQCASAADSLGIQTIADGGIKAPGDAAKALAAGADAVMIGGMLAGTDESPGRPLILEDGRKVKIHRGMASSEAGSANPEGVSGVVEYVGSAKDVIDSITKGIRSACSYVGASSVRELPLRAGFIQISASGLRESTPHDIMGANLW